MTTAAAPTSDDTTAAESDLLSRAVSPVSCVPSAEKVTCWNDGFGLVPVGSFSFVLAQKSGNNPCQVTLYTQNFPYAGRSYPLNDDGTTTSCGQIFLSPPLNILLPYTRPCVAVRQRERY